MSHGRLRVLYFVLGLPQLELQAPPHGLVLLDPLLHPLLRLLLGVAGRLIAAARKPCRLLAQCLRRLLACERRPVQALGFLLAVHLVPARLRKSYLVPRRAAAAGRAWRRTVRARRRRLLHDGMHAPLCGPEAHLVDAQGLHLVLDVLPHVMKRLFEGVEHSLRLLHGVAESALSLHERRLLLLQGHLDVVADLLAQRPLLALLQPPGAQLQRRVLGAKRLLEHRHRVLARRNRRLKALGPLLQFLDHAIGVFDLLAHRPVQSVIHAQVGVDSVVVSTARLVALSHGPELLLLRLRHVERRSVRPLFRRMHAHGSAADARARARARGTALARLGRRLPHCGRT
mmetsp:Transcript_1726/g.4918  ORF Transcript_1726/g.4918 Transcript_1726/m.4918 type:complete len:343 (+) Transcript_1726:594-1622(+)